MKSVILASSRNKNRLKLEFIKNQELVNLVRKIVGKFHINWGIFTDQDDKGNIQIEKIKDIEDELFSFEDEHLKIDIFVGYKKAIFIMISSEKLQQQILDEIATNSKWKKKPSK